jgi:hypothetical protein
VSFSGRILLLVVAVLVATSVAAPFVAWGLAAGFGAAHRFSFPRVYDRVLQIVAVIALVGWRRWLGIGSWPAIGLGRPAERRDLAVGLGLAIGGMVALLGAMWAAGVLSFGWRYPFAKGVQKAILGILAAGLVGAGEEMLFRGVLLHGLLSHLRRGAAVAWVTAIYAVAHFLRGGKQSGPVTLTSGFERLLTAFAPLADPAVIPGLVGFVLLGLVLAAARLGTGALYLPIGLHAGWVFVLRVGRVGMDFPRWPGWWWGGRRPPIVSGVAGWLAIAATGIAVALVLRRRGGRDATHSAISPVVGGAPLG